MTEKTIAELEAEIAARQREIDQRQLTPLRAVLTALEKPAVAAALQACQDNLPNLTGERQTQVQNVITVLTHSPAWLAAQAAAIEAAAAEPAPEAQ